MSTTARLLLTPVAFACGLALSTPSAAAEVYEYANPAAACQLSIPTTDIQVRPKATGFRNESTTKGAFVICGYSQPTKDATDGLPSSIQIYFHSIDDAGRNISSTTVTGVDGLWPMVYSTKTTQSTANGTCSDLAWGPGDFGGTSEIPYGFHVSVTCSLPPQTSITSILNSVQYEIGN